MGITGKSLGLFSDYLLDRINFIRRKNTLSEARNLEMGLTQGGLLACLIYLVAVNDIVVNLNSKDNQWLSTHSDDLTLFFIIPKLMSGEDLQGKIAFVTDNIQNKTCKNGFYINKGKTETLILKKK